MIGGMPIRPVATAPDNTATTTTSLDNSTGTTTENVPVDSMGDTSTEAAPVGFCGQYVDWYDAQVAYENLGATAADPALVNEVDPDWDGIACEVEMA